MGIILPYTQNWTVVEYLDQKTPCGKAEAAAYDAVRRRTLPTGLVLPMCSLFWRHEPSAQILHGSQNHRRRARGQ